MQAPAPVSWRLALVVCLLPSLALIGCSGSSPAAASRLKIGMMPKLVGISYFNACRRGAEEAAAELGVTLTYDGPAVDKVEEQVKIIDRWIAQGYDVIAVAPNDPEVIAPALRRAKQAGIVVLTWDADANPTASGRALLVNQAPTEAIGNTLVDVLAEGVGRQGKTVIITGSATSPNQNAWMEVMHRRLAEKYPHIQLLETLVSNEDQAKAGQLARDVLASHPDLKGIWAITSVALPAAAKAVRDAGRSGEVFVTGLSLPNIMREYVEDGTVRKFVLWNPVDLGYLTVHAGKALAAGRLQPGEQNFGRLRGVQVAEGEVLLGLPLVFDRHNIAEYDF
jgi:ABC-type sugar transport system substrate-binding protein